MLNLERILRDDRLLRAMTGLNRKAFEDLLPSFSEAYGQSAIADLVGCVPKTTLNYSVDKFLGTHQD